MGEIIGLGLTSVVNLLNPEKIIIGGGVADAGDILFDPIKDTIARRAMPIQGSAADIIKLAMLGVARELKKQNLKSKLILTVHDELIIDAVKEEAEKVENILVEQMQNVLQLSVPLTVSVDKGKSWFDAK